MKLAENKLPRTVQLCRLTRPWEGNAFAADGGQCRITLAAPTPTASVIAP
ncbi:hypothetical protein CAter282_1727 [Collimonas arenae]|uniref:Uncharacterized protein n=1 Tax=Collimonas arenae TaxID=279058 RepID=A0A127QHG0_9BURK|nr:hypothetical protein CAter10_1861 [Collimonas arenae]AMP09509.1 hypothetical protein CAter282_1727 [Collimonas arenae]